MFKLCCKRHYRNLATYSWCTTWREHVTKTAPARCRHSAGGGGAPISYDRRRRRQQNVGGGGAAAAAHSSESNFNTQTWTMTNASCAILVSVKSNYLLNALL